MGFSSKVLTGMHRHPLKIRSGHPGSPFNGIIAARILSFLCYKLVHSGKNL